MKSLNINRYKKLLNIERKYFLQLKSNHPYYIIQEKMLKNEVNNYINYRNLNKIYKFFYNYSNSKIKLLDLGCGIGDKSILLKHFFPKWDIFGLETINYDDFDHKKNKPHLYYKSIYKKINKKFNINLGLYDGLNITFQNKSFDIIVLYAVIEHIDPYKRKKFIDAISKKLKDNGFIIITRCPRYYGLIEFISRRLNLGAHPWVLKKEELINLFDKNKFQLEVIEIINSIPNNDRFSKYLSKVLIPIDKFLGLIKWPFATDYFLIIRKKK